MAKQLKEAEQKLSMTRAEKKAKSTIIKLLKDDGHGHHHKAYAERFEKFIFNIVPAEDDPEFTAAISFDDGVIYMSSGFLEDESTFGQLNVLLRHELAHNLMMHQVRMTNKISSKYGEAGYSKIKMSESLHDLINIIEDFEISNERYTSADREVIKNMWLNGRTIHGLLTEEHRDDWTKLKLENMYDALNEEIEEINNDILDHWHDSGEQEFNTQTYKNGMYKQDYLKNSIKNTYYYNNLTAKHGFLHPISSFVKNQGLYHFFPMDKQTLYGIVPAIFKLSSFPQEWQDIIITIYEKVANSSLSKADVYDMIKNIAQASPVKSVDIVDPNGEIILKDILTPEEKLLAVDTLKACLPTLELYNTWFKKVQKVLSDPKYSTQDLQHIFDNISGKGAA